MLTSMLPELLCNNYKSQLSLVAAATLGSSALGTSNKLLQRPRKRDCHHAPALETSLQQFHTFPLLSSLDSPVLSTQICVRLSACRFSRHGANQTSQTPLLDRHTQKRPRPPLHRLTQHTLHSRPHTTRRQIRQNTPYQAPSRSARRPYPPASSTPLQAWYYRPTRNQTVSAVHRSPHT